MFLFATKEPRDAFNRECLRKCQSPQNPVAVIKPTYRKNGTKAGKSSSRHFARDSQVPLFTCMCRGAKVQITGRNILPRLGLFNNAMGIVVDIVYHEDENPNLGHLPKYVLVRFPSYSGPAFIKHDPKIVPIVPITRTCNQGHCCQQTFIPLRLAFAKTIHSYQGQSAGPTGPGQPENYVKRLVINIGTRQFEGNNPGLSYTALGRATQLGDPNDIMTSALFFDGPDMRPSRMLNITLRADGKIYRKVENRDKWVKFLESKTISSGIYGTEKDELFHWAKTFRPCKDEILMFHYKFSNHKT